jgi:hypothetical protein
VSSYAWDQFDRLRSVTRNGEVTSMIYYPGGQRALMKDSAGVHLLGVIDSSAPRFLMAVPRRLRSRPGARLRPFVATNTVLVPRLRRDPELLSNLCDRLTGLDQVEHLARHDDLLISARDSTIPIARSPGQTRRRG